MFGEQIQLRPATQQTLMHNWSNGCGIEATTNGQLIAHQVERQPDGQLVLRRVAEHGLWPHVRHAMENELCKGQVGEGCIRLFHIESA